MTAWAWQPIPAAAAVEPPATPEVPSVAVAVAVVRAVPLNRPPSVYIRVPAASQRTAVAAPDRAVQRIATVAATALPQPPRVQTLGLRQRLDTAAGERRVVSRSVTRTAPVAAAQTRVVLNQARLDNSLQQRRVVSRSFASTKPVAVALTRVVLTRQRLDTESGERRVLSHQLVASTPQRPAQARIVLARQRLDTEARERRVGPRQRITATAPIVAARARVGLLRQRLDTAASERRVVSRSLIPARPAKPATARTWALPQRADNPAQQRRVASQSLASTRPIPAAKSATFALRRRLDTEAGERRVVSRSVHVAPASLHAPTVASSIARDARSTASVIPRRIRPVLVTAPQGASKPRAVYGFSIAEGTAVPAVEQRFLNRRLSVTAPRTVGPPQILAWLGGAAVHEPAAGPRRPVVARHRAPTPAFAPRAFTAPLAPPRRTAVTPRRVPRVHVCAQTAPLRVSRSWWHRRRPEGEPVIVTPPTTYWRFVCPTYQQRAWLDEQSRRTQRVSRAANRLAKFYSTDQSVAVLKIGGTYVEYLIPNQDQIDSATEVYLGGHVHIVDETTADALVAAGYTVEAVP